MSRRLPTRESAGVRIWSVICLCASLRAAHSSYLQREKDSARAISSRRLLEMKPAPAALAFSGWHQNAFTVHWPRQMNRPSTHDQQNKAQLCVLFFSRMQLIKGGQLLTNWFRAEKRLAQTIKTEFNCAQAFIPHRRTLVCVSTVVQFSKKK
jgi:hypothetical protein